MRYVFFLVMAAICIQPALGIEMKWGGAGPNMVSAAKGLPADPGAAAKLWEVKVGTHQYSIPTLDRGRIFIAANDAAVERPGYKRTMGGAVTCLEQATGKMIWQLPVPRYMGGVIPPYHFDQWRCGICSGPVVDGDRIYLIGNRGEVLCLDREGQANGNQGPFVDEARYMELQATSSTLSATSGTAVTSGGEKRIDNDKDNDKDKDKDEDKDKENGELRATDGDILWKYALIPELDVILHDVCGSTILMLGNYLYVCTSNGIDDKHKLVPRPLAPTLIVLDKRTGRLVARDDEKIGTRMLHCNWSSPIAGEAGGRTLVFFGAGDGLLYAFEPVRPPAAGEGVQTLKKVWAHDCNPSEYRYRDGQLLPHSTSSKKLTDGPSEIIGTAVLDQGKIYVAIGQSNEHGPGQGCLSCVDAATGKEMWASKLVDRSLATPAIADGLLYIPDYSGKLHCFDTATGERAWVHELEGRTWFSSAYVADGKVYVGTENNLLWVLKAGREKQVMSRTHLDTPAITTVADEGVLYIPTQTSLIAASGKPAN